MSTSCFDREDETFIVLVNHDEGVDDLFTQGPIDLSELSSRADPVSGRGNGSGKSSLAKLLAGLCRPERGAILLNGEPVDDASRFVYAIQIVDV